MKEKLFQTIKKVSVYSLGKFIATGLTFALIPLYSKKMTITEYGDLSIFETSATFLILLLSSGIPSFLLRWYPDANTTNEKKEIVSLSFFSVFIVCFAFLLFSLPFAEFFSKILFDHSNYKYCFYIFILYVFIDSLNKIPFQLIRLYENASKYNLLTILNIAITLIVCIILVGYYNWGILGVLIGLFAGSFTVFLFSFHIVIPYFTLKIKKKLLKEMYKFSFPLAFSAISYSLLFITDKYLLLFYNGSEDVGIYSLSYRIASIITLFIISPFQIGFVPIAYKMYNDDNVKEFFARVHNYVFYGLVLVSLFISIFAKDILTIFTLNNQDYWIAYKYVPLNCLTVIIGGMQYLYLINLRIVKKSKYDFKAVVISLIINLILNMLLIPIWGIYGAIISSFVAFLVMTIFFNFYSQKFFYIKFKYKKCFDTISVAILIYLLSIVDISQIFFSIAFKVFLCVIFIAFIYKNNFDPIEKINIKKFIKL